MYHIFSIMLLKGKVMNKIASILLFIMAISLCFVGCQEVPGEVSKSPVTSFSVTVEPEKTQAAEPAPTASLSPAEALLAKLSTEQKVGQLFFARFPQDSDALEEIKQYEPAGYILFGVNFEHATPQSIQKTLSDCQAASGVPLLFGIDEEGGTVVRASKYPAFRSKPFASPQSVYKAGGLDGIAADAKEKSALLADLGFTVNFAPVCDVSTDKKDFIFARSFGKPAKQTSEYVSAVVTAMRGTGVDPVLKHFPGYGNNVDTHTGIAIDNRSLESFKNSDFLPFRAGIQAGAPAVLVSHNIVTCMDETYPASLSEDVHKILRNELSFGGVVITDDLAMEAVASYAGEQEVAVLAVLAGNDLLISSDLKAQYESVLAAVNSGEIPMQTLDNAVRNVLEWKQQLGLI